MARREPMQDSELETRSIIIHFDIDITDIHIYEDNITNIPEKPPTIITPPPPEASVDVVDISDSTETEDIKGYNPKTLSNSTSPWSFEDKWKGSVTECRIMCDGKEYKNKTVDLMLHKYHADYKERSLLCPIRCWQCFHSIEDKACGIPRKYRNGTFYMTGFFCTFNCALRYNYEMTGSENRLQERESLIRMMYRMSLGPDETFVPLVYAPPREALKIFGGCLTTEEYRKNNSYCRMIYEPSIPISAHFEANTPILEDEGVAWHISTDLSEFVQ